MNSFAAKSPKYLRVLCRKFLFGNRLRRYSNAQSGLALVEFAILAPILIALLLAVVEFGQVLTVDRRVSRFASAAADLVAQSKSVDQAALNDIYALSKTVLDPYDTGNLSLTLTSVVADSNNDTTVDWSAGFNGGTTHATGGDYSLPEGLTQPFASVVVAEVSYVYTSPVSEYITGNLTLSDTFYLRPRRVPFVSKTD